MDIATFLPIVFLFGLGLIFKSLLSTGTKRHQIKMEKILEEEMTSNFHRAKDVPQKAFLKPNMDFLSSINYDKYDDRYRAVASLKEHLIKKSQLTMVRLSPPLTNREVKEQYGIVNLDTVAQGEENYHNYINSANALASSLIALGDYGAAKKVLEHTIFEMKSYVLRSYTLSLDIYKKTDINQIPTFLKAIDSSKILLNYPDLKEKIQDYSKNIQKEVL